ncbi:hypothetical protein V6N12_075701 [Hibiscus sabdariffa]|uniref:RNase H type-1 domain-containing protein n=1 Tax=Hibiscus sabdariffa TaxID=183260 RepID=A0ABR2C8C8_9ROSI
MQQEVVFICPSLAVGCSLRGTDDGEPAHWSKLPWGRYKLNSDGAVAHGSDMTACGGTVCDEEGSWFLNFFRKLVVYSVSGAELWGLYEGLLAAWSIGIRYLLIESDSLEAVNILNNRNGLTIVLYIVEIMTRL